MLRIEIQGRALKNLFDKAMASIAKKSNNAYLTRVYLYTDKEGKNLCVLGTDYEHYTEARTCDFDIISPGMVGIDAEDVKILSKINGWVSLEELEGKDSEDIHILKIKCGNKMVSIPVYENDSISYPKMGKEMEHVADFEEKWLLKTLVGLSQFNSYDDINILNNVINFNMSEERVEALDGSMVAMKKMQYKNLELQQNFMLHNKCIPVLKKLMDNKSSDLVSVYQDKERVYLNGTDFSYTIRRVCKEYYNVNNLIGNSEYSFIPDRDELIAILKYDCDLLKSSKYAKNLPIIFHVHNKELYCYVETAKYQAMDKVETEYLSMEENMFIGINPKKLLQIFMTVDSENPVCRMTNSAKPMYVDGDEYSFLICPIRITSEDTDGMEKILNGDSDAA